MEKLKYMVEDRTLAQLLGVQNFSNKESAILELVKNGFDAGSKKLEIHFEKNTILIQDCGKGMNKTDILKNWMHVGKSEKGYEINLANGEKRVLSGSKGVGRFALARLGNEIEIISKKENENGVIWKTDWENSYVEENDEIKDIGTVIKITNLRDKWSKKTVNNLGDYLSRTYNDTSMKILLYYQDQVSIEIHPYFNDVKLGLNCVDILKLQYDSKNMILKCEIESDEFEPNAQKWCEENIWNYKKVVNVYDLIKNNEFNNDYDKLENVLMDLGDFSAELYFALKGCSSIDMEKFLYKHRIFENRLNSGIILYRNAFSISSLEGKKDWLELDKRNRMSPAAATHPTGNWRVRENQISGKVIIDKHINKNLVDMSNRQGMEENIYFEIFINILQEGIGLFESYRQSIIRGINKKNKDIKEVKKTSIINNILKNPNSIKNLNLEDRTRFVEELVDMKKQEKTYKDIIDINETRYKYDIRILNVLSTLGLKAMSISHELRNDRNKLRHLTENVIDSLKIYGFWETLNKDEYTEYSDRNIPELLESNEKINKKILTFMDTMLEESEKTKFIPQNLKIVEIINNIKQIWEYDYSWIEIEVNVDDSIAMMISEDVINVILDNLILNSIQQNSEKQNLKITITAFFQNEFLNVIYRDDGIGLNNKYKNNPFKILEVHETSRIKGHGLGMWIVNNTLDFTGGKITEIKNDDGFYIEFLIGGENNAGD